MNVKDPSISHFRKKLSSTWRPWIHVNCHNVNLAHLKPFNWKLIVLNSFSIWITVHDSGLWMMFVFWSFRKFVLSRKEFLILIKEAHFQRCRRKFKMLKVVSSCNNTWTNVNSFVLSFKLKELGKQKFIVR